MKISIIKSNNNLDYEYLRILRNKPYVRKNSKNKKLIKKKEHLKWLSNIKNKQVFFLKNKSQNIGYIRVEKKYVSWALEKKYWGKLKFFLILKKKTSKKKQEYKCLIDTKNTKSQIVALKAGFKIIEKKNNFILYKKFN